MALFQTGAGYRDATKALTIKALQERQKQAAAAAVAAQTAPDVNADPLSAVSHVLGNVTAGFQQSRADQREADARQTLAGIMAKIDPNAGPTMDQIAAMQQLDPDLAEKQYQYALEARRRAEDRANQLADTDAAHQWTTETEQRTAAQRKAETEAGWQHTDTQEATVDTRELQQAKDAAAEAQRVKEEEHKRALEEGKIVALTPEEAAARNLPAGRTWAVSADGTSVTDITPEIKETFSYRPMTDAERVSYNIPAGQGARMKISSTTGSAEPEGVGGATPQDPAVASEVAARVGLMKDFLENYPDVIATIDAKKLTGPIDYATSVQFGRGEGGKAYGIIQSGSDALLRNLTGAGMPEAEALRYVKRYEPVITDDAPTLRRKIEKLRTDMLNVREAALAGRKWDTAIDPKEVPPPPPDDGTKPPATDPAAAAAAPVDLPKPKTDAEYNALPNGASYIDPDTGETLTKGAKKK